MGFWALLLVNAALVVVSALLRPRQKSTLKAERPAVEPADVGRPVPVVFGTCRVPLRIVRFDRYYTRKIYEKVRVFGIPVGRTHIGYKYYATITGLLSWGPISLIDLIADGKYSLLGAGTQTVITYPDDSDSLTPSTSTSDAVSGLPSSHSALGHRTDGYGTVHVTAPTLYGGDSLGGNGGLSGSITVYFGNNVVTETVLDGITGTTHPRWRKFAYLQFTDFYFGNSARLPSIEAVVQRFPQLEGITSEGADALAGAALYECLTNHEWGEGLPAYAIDRASFSPVHDIPVSFTIDEQLAGESVADELLRTLNGVLYTHPTTGLLTLRVVAAGDASVATIDESNCRAVEWTPPAPLDTVNQITVAFVDRVGRTDADGTPVGRFQRNTVTETNMAGVQTLGRVQAETVEFFGVSTEAVARQLAKRELRTRGTPVGRARLYLDRANYALTPGAKFTLTWAEHGLSGVAMRVLTVDWGTLEDPTITVDAAQDAFDLAAVESVSTDGDWVNPAPSGRVILPRVEEVVTVSGTTGTLGLRVYDEQSRIMLVEFQLVPNGVAGEWEEDEEAPYSASVTLGSKVPSRINWRVTYTLPGGTTDTLTGSATFPLDMSVYPTEAEVADAIGAHHHDDRYYTQAEVDALLAGGGGSTTVAVAISVDGGGDVLAIGAQAPFAIPFAGTVTGWTLLADQAGDLVVDLWKDTYANYPPTAADSLWGGSVPALAGAAKAQATGLAIPIVAGDTFIPHIASAATITRATLTLTITRS